MNKYIENTLKSFTKIEDGLYMMEYNCPYSLDKMLKAGKKGILGIAKVLQSEIKKNIHLNPLSSGFACSTFNVKNKEKENILGRNFDYKKAPSIVIWTNPQNDYKSIAVCNANFMLYTEKSLQKNNTKLKRLMAAPYVSMDGMNEKGLAIAVLEIKTKATHQNTGKTPISTVVAIRAILDKCKTVDEAIELLKKYDMQDLLLLNYHYQILDSTGKSVIVEYVNNEMHVIEQKKEEAITSNNFFLTPGGDNKKERGRLRYKKIVEKLKETNGIMDELESMKLLSQATVNYRHKILKHPVITLWSSVYNVNKKTMHIAAAMNYKKIYKFELNKPLKYKLIETNYEPISINEGSKSVDLNTDAVLSGRNIIKTYGEGTGRVEALKDVSVDIYSGELLAILGSSGSGKSTLLNVLSGMDAPSSGDIFINGLNITNFNDRQLTKYRKNNISFVFQSFNLIGEITALENIMLTAKNKKAAYEALKKVGLEDKKDKYPSELSGGQQQRISIARALASDSKILFCDEPTGALDYDTGKNILVELEKLVKEEKKTVVIVTHTREIGKMADRVIEMKNGKIINEIVNKEKISAKEVEW